MNAIISVIIPTYGTPTYLEQAVKSVQRQTLLQWELIVVDDNDPDTEARRQTAVLMNRMAAEDDRISYLQHDRNKNGAAARNTGIAKARGRYVAFLDSDDEYLPDRLSRCLAVMEKADGTVAGVYTGCEFRRGGKVYHTEKNVAAGNFLVQTLACTFMFCTGSNLFIRKSVIDELCGFDEAFIRHQDYEFLARLFEKGYTLAAISEVLVVKNNENMNLPDVGKMIEVKRQYLQKFKAVIDRLPLKEQRSIYHTQSLLVAEAALRSGDRQTAREYYARSRQYGGLSLREEMRRVIFYILQLIRR